MLPNFGTCHWYGMAWHGTAWHGRLLQVFKIKYQ